MEINDEYIVHIERMSNLGLGIARVDGIVLFVEGACPGDKALVKVIKTNKNYATARIVKLETPSSHRVQPFCALQKLCGACQLQFINYEYQLKIKKEIVQDAMHKLANLDIDIPDVIRSPKQQQYRHKIQYPISSTKVSKRILAGYYKPKSHEIVNIKHCPIQPEICDEIIDFIRLNADKYKVSGFDETLHKGDLRHVVLRVSEATGKILVTLVVNAGYSGAKLENFAKAVFEHFPQVSGACLNFNPKKTNVIMSNETICVCGEPFIEEQLLGKTFKIGANTFFQVNPSSAENIFRYVRNHIRDNLPNAQVLDAYAGVSAFGICVADVCEKVVCVEENTASTDLAKTIAQLNNISNIEINNMDAGKFFASEKRKFDAIILDPPRKGCTRQSLDAALKLCKKQIIYVSCNPATLARDLKYLCEKGCKVKSVQPFDMFCHTFHVENVAIVEI